MIEGCKRILDNFIQVISINAHCRTHIEIIITGGGLIVYNAEKDRIVSCDTESRYIDNNTLSLLFAFLTQSLHPKIVLEGEYVNVNRREVTVETSTKRFIYNIDTREVREKTLEKANMENMFRTIYSNRRIYGE